MLKTFLKTRSTTALSPFILVTGYLLGLAGGVGYRGSQMPPELSSALVSLLIIVLGAIGLEIRTRAKLYAARAEIDVETKKRAAQQDAANEAFVLKVAETERLERAKLMGRVNDLSDALSAAKATIDALRVQIEQAQVRSAERDRIIGELRAKVHTLATERDVALAENYTLTEKIKQLEERVQAQRLEIDRLMARVRELEALLPKPEGRYLTGGE